mmetsp:Transcript_27556/g.50492  ORF Transcript_27556/g.50492 Transcript_27556/m.50492 type:complete len:159 (+) Transcript_27556:30-506(+)
MPISPPDVSHLYSVKIDNVNYKPSEFMDVRNELKDMFGKYGEIGDVHLPRDRNFAFVRFTNERDAEDAADEMNGKKFNGDELKVQLSNKPKKAPEEMARRSRSRSRGGGRDRRGGGYRDDRRGGRGRDDSRVRQRHNSRDRGSRRGRRNDSRDDSRRR